MLLLLLKRGEGIGIRRLKVNVSIMAVCDASATVEVIKEDKKLRAGFPMHHTTLTEITTNTMKRYRDIAC